MSKPVILTGLRANNNLHIGNYLGALLPMVDMAKQRAGEYQVNLFVPDLHSFTTPIDHAALYNQVMQNIKVYVAAGLPISHDDVHIYRQSYVPAHSELAWILDCFTGMGEMNRMTQFKDKSGRSDEFEKSREIKDILDKQKEGEILLSRTMLMDLYNASLKGIEATVGLFNYPVLMAADILLYNAILVPVGDDQTQHLEFTRDIAERLNNRFGEDLFTVPLPVPKQHEFFGKDQGLRIRDLVDPSKKMSKSGESDKGIVFLNDSPQAATKKIMSATTDSFGEIKFDIKERPGISNLLQILALLTKRNQQEVNREWEGQTSYGELKKAVAEAVAQFLQDFQNRLNAVNDQAVHDKLAASEKAMNQIANQTLLGVQKAVGLRSRE